MLQYRRAKTYEVQLVACEEEELKPGQKAAHDLKSASVQQRKTYFSISHKNQ